ncbi:hypothetical protein SAMN07250955_12034 [Arboricoccus pini]|uniref:Methyltransferase type 11 domain-containing protein n=1 Tax=Arboricoccus pini TaxID=1963835 RepID=A0A212S1Z2_9PROT|nr:methyltransferase domain-containing protein [Arboricoccus pini]SNB79142.1 hypothetical protein SAMN07250955_12034 [Arboricoccus pini]
MKAEIEHLHAFYDTRGGQLARRLIAAQLRRLLGDMSGRTLVGIGYLGGFVNGFPEAERAISLLPSGLAAPGFLAGRQLGRVYEDAVRQRLALIPDDDLPIADGVADRVVLIHALENSLHLKRLLREAWRITADGGSVLAVVPNRRGFWCWSERTPFGQGRPYTMQQLKRTFAQHLFEPCGEARALFAPPSVARIWPSMAMRIERIVQQVAPELSGIVIVEARKSVMAPTAIVPLSANKARRRRYTAIPEIALAARDRDESRSKHHRG